MHPGRDLFHIDRIPADIRDHICARIHTHVLAVWDYRREAGMAGQLDIFRAPSVPADVRSSYTSAAALIDALLGGAVADNAEAMVTELTQSETEPADEDIRRMLTGFAQTCADNRPYDDHDDSDQTGTLP